MCVCVCVCVYLYIYIYIYIFIFFLSIYTTLFYFRTDWFDKCDIHIKYKTFTVSRCEPGLPGPQRSPGLGPLSRCCCR